MDTILNFKTDKKLKAQAKQVAGELGLPLGTIMNHYLKQFVADKQVLFTDHPQPTTAIVTELKKLSAQARAGKEVSPTFTNAKDATAWLNF